MESLKKSHDFKKVIEGGSREIMETITIYRLPNQSGKTRTGISVTKKTGGSVQRNLVKRRIREAIRENAAELPAGEDIVIIARRGTKRASYEDIARDIRKTGRASRD